MRPGGRESWPIKIIEMAGRTLYQTLVKTDPFNGNKCTDKKCIPSQTDSKINCRKTVYEEGTYIASNKYEVLNSKSEWHQAKILRTTTTVVQGGAEVLRQQPGQGTGH